MLDVLRVRRNSILASIAAAIALGAAAWLLLGPLWTIAGLLVGYLIPPLYYMVGTVFLSPSPAALIETGRPEEALRRLRFEEATARGTARRWPSQFNEMLAHNLMVQSDALHALHQDAQALRSADEGVGIYQALAADRPAKYAARLSWAIYTQAHMLEGLGRQADAIAAIQTSIRLCRNLAIAEPDENLPDLARSLTCMAGWLADIDSDAQALAAATEATGIYWRKPIETELPTHAARAALLEGRLLCQQARYHEAARQLARGWTLAASQQLHDLISTATPAVRATYRAEPDNFTSVWQAETGTRPPDWLTTS